jgi:hypothetical protein
VKQVQIAAPESSIDSTSTQAQLQHLRTRHYPMLATGEGRDPSIEGMRSTFTLYMNVKCSFVWHAAIVPVDV